MVLYHISRPRTPTFVVNPASPQCERNLPITLNLNNTTTTDPEQSYAWYVNGSLIATTSNTTYALTAPGTYIIKFGDYR